MSDNIPLVDVIVALTAAWIEWLPRKSDILIDVVFAIIIIGIGLGWMPKWYGWVVTVIGVADLAWQYQKGVREFGWPHLRDLLERFARFIRAAPGVAASFFSRAEELETPTPDFDETAAKVPSQPRIPRRVWIGGIALTAFSPIAAIPAAIVLAIILTLINSMLVDAESLAFSFAPIAKSVLGNAFLIQVATLDIVIRGFLLTGPLLLFAGVGGAKWADRAGCYWQRLLGAGVLLGALYPAIFIVASTIGWFDEPFFN